MLHIGVVAIDTARQGLHGRRFKLRGLRRVLASAALLALAGSAGGAETVTDAHYAEPVDRYGHFALGRPHEYARLTALTSSGRSLTLQLPEDEVFEDLAPRLLRLAPDDALEILTVVSRRGSGARLVLIRPTLDTLEISAESAAIGTSMRWLNPVGAADLDGDGRAEIAAVITPHIGGTLKVYRRAGGELVEIAALVGFSNHVYGSAELALSAPMSIDGRMHLVVPDARRTLLRIVALDNGRLVDTGHCPLPAPIIGAIESIQPGEFSVHLSSGRRRIALDDCFR